MVLVCPDVVEITKPPPESFFALLVCDYVTSQVGRRPNRHALLLATQELGDLQPCLPGSPVQRNLPQRRTTFSYTVGQQAIQLWTK